MPAHANAGNKCKGQPQLCKTATPLKDSQGDLAAGEGVGGLRRLRVSLRKKPGPNASDRWLEGGDHHQAVRPSAPALPGDVLVLHAAGRRGRSNPEDDFLQ